MRAIWGAVRDKNNVKGGFHFKMRTLNIIVYAIALGLAVAAYLKGEQRHILGITEASKTLLLVLPTLVGAFLIAGYVRVLMPEDVDAAVHLGVVEAPDHPRRHWRTVEPFAPTAHFP